MSGRSLDSIYVAASELDFRYTRICVASVRHFYPTARVRLIAGGELQRSLVRELRTHWDVDVAPFPRGRYGWGFVKLEPLFGKDGDTFLMLDSDTIMAGPVLSLWSSSNAAFVVDDETQSESDSKRLYYDWREVKEADPAATPPGFLFNTGQWFGTAGALSREDFSPWIEWTLPRRLAHPSFMCGEQGLLNYVVNRKFLAGDITVDRRTLMHWPGHSIEGLDPASVMGYRAPAVVVHWAGIKKIRLKNMAGAGLLRHFEDVYYERIPLGAARKSIAAIGHLCTQVEHQVRTWVRLRYRRVAGGTRV